MPVYLCQPGCMAAEPWRHGIQVYAAPFPMDDVPAPAATSAGAGVDLSASNAAPPPSNDVANWSNDNSGFENSGPAAGFRQRRNESDVTDGSGLGNADSNDVLGPNRPPQLGGVAATSGSSRFSSLGLPIRRIRHAEVVLGDDVCIAYGRHWLRLRWPGHKGGFAGYIALGKINEPLPRQISNALRGTSLLSSRRPCPWMWGGNRYKCFSPTQLAHGICSFLSPPPSPTAQAAQFHCLEMKTTKPPHTPRIPLLP